MMAGFWRRFALLAFGAVIFFLSGTSVSAGEPSVHVSVLMSHDAPAFGETLAGFRNCLEEEGLAADYRVFPLQGGVGQVPKLPENPEGPAPRIILALGSLALNSAVQMTTDIPIVAGMVLRREDIQQVPNATGVFLEFPLDIQFTWLRQMLPRARRVGVLYNPAENQERIEKASEVAAAMGLELVPRQVSGPQDIPGALESLTNWADVLWGISDRTVVTPETAKNLLLFSFRNRIPFVGLSRAWAKAGAFYALDRDYRDLGRQCGELAVRIVAGEKPGSIPPEAPRRTTYFLNRKTAQQMKIEIDPELLRHAEKVY